MTKKKMDPIVAAVQQIQVVALKWALAEAERRYQESEDWSKDANPNFMEGYNTAAYAIRNAIKELVDRGGIA